MSRKIFSTDEAIAAVRKSHAIEKPKATYVQAGSEAYPKPFYRVDGSPAEPSMEPQCFVVLPDGQVWIAVQFWTKHNP